jgi:hypothetical protein
MVARDASLFQRYEWETVIVDEGAPPAAAHARTGSAWTPWTRQAAAAAGMTRPRALPSRVPLAQQPPLCRAGHRLKSAKGLARRVIQALSIKWLLLLTGAGAAGARRAAGRGTDASALHRPLLGSYMPVTVWPSTAPSAQPCLCITAMVWL